jgi:hypothetical protein
MYYTVLLEAAKLYQSSMNDLKLFLSAIYHKSFPNRGESLVVGFGDPNVTASNINTLTFMIITLN